MNFVTEWLQETLGLSPQLQTRIITTAIVVVALWAVNRLVQRLGLIRVDDVRLRYRLRKIMGYVLSIIGAFAVVRVWLGGLAQISTYLGLLSAGLAIAMRDPLVNLAGWAFIALRQPFEVGDRIEIGEHAGDVIDLSIFQFTILEIRNWVDADQSTGRIIHIPNGKVFTEPLANYSTGFEYVWNEIPVLITFESNWRKAKQILLDLASKHGESVSEAAAQRVMTAAQKFMIFYSVLTPTVYTSVRDCGVLLTIRHICEIRGRRAKSQAIWEDILEEFGKCDDIDFAYPTRRIFNNLLEGKPACKQAPADDTR
jgi:small-conductance mechanosensitive channel